MKNYMIFSLFMTLFSCSSLNYKKTVDFVDLDRFMGRWYVMAGRLTFLEVGAHNAVEEYSWNEEKERIDINFFFNEDDFDGELTKLPQRAWIENKKTNAYWQVRPFWPLLFDYLVIDLADDYSWVVIGVPSGSYLWVMARDWSMPKKKVSMILEKIAKKGYPVHDIYYVPQKW